MANIFLPSAIGGATFFISLIVLLIWIPLKQKPGVGTLMNSIIISIVMDLSTTFLNFSSTTGKEALS